jgi:hypothetical protein
VLVKDQWVGLCEQVLNVSSAYWCYGPSKLKLCNHLVETSLPYSKAVVREKEEVIQGDDRASLSLIDKISFGCRGIFHSCGD